VARRRNTTASSLHLGGYVYFEEFLVSKILYRVLVDSCLGLLHRQRLSRELKLDVYLRPHVLMKTHSLQPINHGIAIPFLLQKCQQNRSVELEFTTLDNASLSKGKLLHGLVLVNESNSLLECPFKLTQTLQNHCLLRKPLMSLSVW
jgi:hypothetical protein